MEWGNILGGSGLFLSVSAIIVVLFQTFGKKPSDRQAEVEFAVELLREQITKAERDAERWLEVERFLRGELDKADADKQKLRELLGKANAQIEELLIERQELQKRLTRLAEKVGRGEDITLEDIAGHRVPKA